MSIKQGDIVSITPIDSSMFIEYIKRFTDMGLSGKAAMVRGNNRVLRKTNGTINHVNTEYCEPLYHVQLEGGNSAWLTPAHMIMGNKKQLWLEVEL